MGSPGDVLPYATLGRVLTQRAKAKYQQPAQWLNSVRQDQAGFKAS